jgi:hypothetical protein
VKGNIVNCTAIKSFLNGQNIKMHSPSAWAGKRRNSVYKGATFGIFGSIMRLIVSALCALACFTPAFAQERQWSLDASEREAFLVFGVPDTDDVGLSFWCEIGKPRISIFAPVPHGALKKDQRLHIDLDFGDDKFHIIAKGSHAPNSTAASVEALVDPNGTVMKAASQAESVSITALGHKASYPLVDADFEGLLRVCSGTIEN